MTRANWYDALAYANAISAREGYPSCYTLRGCTGTPGVNMTCTGATFTGLTCRGYRLPTEAEWEYAARGGVASQTYAGDLQRWDCLSSLGSVDPIAHYACSTSGSQPVGSRRPNAYGLFDMIGGTSEWTWDKADHAFRPRSGVFLPTPYDDTPVIDPLGADSGERRIVRSQPAYVPIVSHRQSTSPDSRGHGFRHVRTAP